MKKESIRCSRIRCRDVFASERLKGFVGRYAEECGYSRGNPDKDLYEQVESQGTLKCIGLFAGDQLVGFSTYVIGPSTHVKGTTVAFSDSLWVEPEFRKGRSGLLLISETERFAREDGCRGILWGVCTGTQAEKVFARLARPVNTIFWKEL